MTIDTKTAILDSAERIARRRGFNGFSYADLAAAVGIRKASIHHHFASKAILSTALMQRYHKTLEAACSEIDQANDTAAARLTALMKRYFHALEDGQSLCLCVSFSTSTESLSQDTLAEMDRFRTMMTSWLATTFSLGKVDGTISNITDPTAEALAALPLLEGAQLAARVAHDPKRFETALGLLCGRCRT